MALPDNVLSSQAVEAELLSPDVLQSRALYDYELGGAGLNDPSEGLRVQTWVCYPSGTSIFVEGADGNATEVLSEIAGSITSVSLAFDQNMRPTIAYVAGGEAYLYWFDSVPQDFTVTQFADAENPRVCLDDKRPLESGSSDIILAYKRAGGLYHRLQRDRYTVEYLLDADIGNLRLRNIGMGSNNRLHFMLS